ncbi:hypothetical protein HEP87_18700 [Streptomyces sp. S1D4-11]
MCSGETTAGLAEASASPQAQEAFYRIVDTLTRLGTSGAPLAVHPVVSPAQALLAALGDSLLPILDAVEPAVQEAADALGDLMEAGSPLLPAVAGVAAGALLALTPVIRAAADVLRDSSPELRRIADALTSALAPLLPLQVALAERAAAAGVGVVRAALPPLADLTEAAAATTNAVRPVLIAQARSSLSPASNTYSPCSWHRRHGRGGWLGRRRYGCPRRCRLRRSGGLWWR